jgi:Tfp pilus assembly protein FimT
MPLLTHADSTQATIAKKQTRRGTTLMEYVMMLSLIFVACMVAVGYLGTSNSGNLSNSSNAINNSLQNGNSGSSNGNNKSQKKGK